MERRKKAAQRKSSADSMKLNFTFDTRATSARVVYTSIFNPEDGRNELGRYAERVSSCSG